MTNAIEEIRCHMPDRVEQLERWRTKRLMRDMDMEPQCDRCERVLSECECFGRCA